MSRGKGYTRKMRAKHIKRKKNIVLHVSPWMQSLNNGNGWYPHDGQYSKGKIHCSCPLCSIKAYYGKHMPTISEQRRLDEAEANLNDFLNELIIKDTDNADR